ncbi:MAG: hypothetical protein JWO06_1529 [Bacteroidota bacterium]|nr:hypothetical protein [Bacteroidota bacterium]
MKLLVSVLFFLLFFWSHVFSQKEIIATATEFITAESYGKANHYLDSILKKHPKNVDALMMKGNVLLNYTWQHTSKHYFNIERAESVFDTTSINQSFFVPIIPDDTSKLIEHYWKQCLAIDSTRNDIKKGLCSLYSISLRIDALKKQLLQIKKLITESDENAYVYAEYARNIKVRGQFDQGMMIYQFIADMFPHLAGIRCDMAGEYFYNGRPNDALRYLDSTLSKNDIDQTSFINAATIYSMLGYYDVAYKTFKKYSERDTLLVANFYKGLTMFAQMDTGFYDQLLNFIQHADEKSYYDEIQLAQKLIPYRRASFDFEDYLALATNSKIPAYYKVLLHQRGMKQFKESCTPFLFYGYFQCTLKNYGMATQFLEEFENCKPQTEQADYWRMLSAYALYQSGDTGNALKYFEPLLKSKDAFRKQAAEYFTAKTLLGTGEKYGATLFEELRDEKEATKYRWLVNK